MVSILKLKRKLVDFFKYNLMCVIRIMRRSEILKPGLESIRIMRRSGNETPDLGSIRIMRRSAEQPPIPDLDSIRY